MLSISHMQKTHSKPLKHDLIGIRLFAQPSVCLCTNNCNFRLHEFFVCIKNVCVIIRRLSYEVEVKLVLIGIGCKFCVVVSNYLSYLGLIKVCVTKNNFIIIHEFNAFISICIVHSSHVHCIICGLKIESL